MVFGFQSVFAADASDAAIKHVAVDGRVTYYDAFPNALQTGTYTLLKDIVRPNRLVQDVSARETVLDLNGHNITSTASDYGILLERSGSYGNNKQFKLINSGGPQGGNFIVDRNTDAAIECQGKYVSVVIGENVNIINGSVNVAYENENVDIYGNVSVGNRYAITTNKSTAKNAIINIHKPSVIQSGNIAVYLSGEGTVNIDGGTVTGATGVFQKDGALVISDGDISGTGSKSSFTYSAGGANATGDALVVDNTDLPVIAVTGGRFTSTNAAASASYGVNREKFRFIEGGTFKGKEQIDLVQIVKDALYAVGSNNDVYVGDYGAKDYADSYPDMVVPIPEGMNLAFNGQSQMGIKGSHIDFTGEGVTGTRDGAFATDIGTYTVNARLNKNYVWADKTFRDKTITFSISDGKCSATVKGYKGKYDGKEHSISIYAVAPSNSVVTYSTDGINYTLTNPSFRDIGMHNVYYRVECQPYYAPLEGVAVVEISGTTADEQAAEKVVNMIENLPVNILLTDEQDVTKARTAYEALSDVQKQLVSNVGTLVKAENRIQDLKDTVKGKEVDKVIGNIPADETLATREQVAAARKAYDALTDAEKEKVDPVLVKRLENTEFYFAKVDARAKKVTILSAKAKKGKKAVVKWEETDADGYQVVYSRSKSFSKRGSKSTTGTSKKITRLKAGKKYYVKVRPYRNIYNPSTKKMEKIYGDFSKVKTFKAKK